MNITTPTSNPSQRQIPQSNIRAETEIPHDDYDKSRSGSKEIVSIKELAPEDWQRTRKWLIGEVVAMETDEKWNLVNVE